MVRKSLFLIAFLLIMVNSVLSQTIYDIQYTTDPGGNSPYVGQVVTVMGVATVSQGVFDNTTYFIQDGEGPWNGIMIYDTDTTRNIEEGDLVQITGEVSEYYGKTEIGYLDEVIVLSKNNVLPRAYLVQTGEIDTAEAYEGVLIRCAHVVVTDPNIGYGEWLINDGSGDCRVDDLAGYSYTPVLNDTILHIIGIVDFAYDDFKIEPRGDGDIILTLDGTGKAYLDPDSVPNGYPVTEEITVLASVDTLRSYSITVPFEFEWSGDSMDVVLTGTGNTGATCSVSGSGTSADPYVVTVSNATPTETNSAVVTINNLLSPDSTGTFTFTITTAGAGGTLTPIPSQPEVLVLSTDGCGTVAVVPDEVSGDSTVYLDFQIRNGFGVLERISLQLPPAWQWTGNRSDVILSGSGLAAAQCSVPLDTLLHTYVISIDSASVDIANNGTIRIRNLVVPDSFGFYVFPVQTAGPGGSLQAIAEDPVVLVRRSDGTIPIIAVDENDANGIPLLIDEYVRIRGVVTAADEFGDQSYIQDNTGGVCVYGISDFFASGDTITVSGTVYQYYGLTELSPSTFGELHGRGPVPGPEVVTCYDITTDGLGGIEQYEGELVMIRGVTTGASVFPSEGNITVTDSTGSCEVRIKEETNLPGVETPDSVFDIIGMVSQFQYSSPYIGGYQLMPRSLDDIIKGGDGSGEAEAVTSTISAQDTSFVEFHFTAGRDTIRVISITIPLEWYWSGDVQHVSLNGSGFASATVESITGDGITKQYEIVIANASVHTGADGAVSVHTISPNGNTGRWSFPVKTAASGGFLKEIYTAPVVFSVYQIHLVQKPGTDGYSSQFEGDSVYVAGSVTGPSVSFSSSSFNSFYIQDASGGVNIYSGKGRQFEDGEMVVIAGVVTEYNGLTEVSTSSEGIHLLPGTETVSPSLLELNRGITEELEGCLVRVENALVMTKPSIAGGGSNFQAYNGRTIIDIRVNDETGIDLSGIDEGVRLDINGIGGQYDSEAPYNSGYQMLPRFPEDVSILGEPGGSGPFSLAMYPNPFSIEYGEIVTIKVNSPDPTGDRLSLTLYDLKGRRVKKVFSSIPGGASTHFWYGKDERQRAVAPGIYVAHLERKQANGKMESLQKAIVVGAP
jgi:DNA/RNA endonuclease YhcR with UshA esterase domain